MRASASEPMYQPLEAVSFYRQSKNKREAIKVIMCGNIMSEADVIHMLLANGIKQQELPRGGTVRSYTKPAPPAPAEPEEAQDIEPETQIQREPQPDTVEQIVTYVQQLRNRKAELLEEVDAIDGKLNVIRLAVTQERAE